MRKIELFAAVAGFLMIFGLCWYLLYHAAKGITQWSDKHQAPKSVLMLKPTEVEKFLITPNHVTTIERVNGKTEVKTEYVPDRATITLQKDGSVSVVEKRSGLVLEPFIGLGYAEAPRAVVGARLAYYSRLGLNVGLSARSSFVPRIFVAASYNVISNVSVFVGVQHDKNVIAGITVRL